VISLIINMSSCEDVFIIDGCRTAVGKLNGCFSSLQAHELGGVVIKHLVDKYQLQSKHVSEVIMGQVLTAGAGQNPARQASVKGGLDYTVPACGISFLCGSGMKAVVNGLQSIKTGDSTLVIAGGQESMTNAPHCVNMRSGVRFGDSSLKDIMLNDGLMDAFNKYHMGQTAENVAKQWNISREEQDVFSVSSQQKIGVAQMEGYFTQEIVPVDIVTRKESITITKDEFAKPNTTLEALSRLRPSFSTDSSASVTAGNASGINDGAAAVLLATPSVMNELGIKEAMCRIVSWAQVAIDPSIMGVAPLYAIKKAVSKAKWNLNDIDLFELNEAFAAQSLAVIKELQIPIEKVNVCGGSIGIGHPIGASGCRILVTLIHAMKRLNKSKGVAALCIGGGMGIAICVEVVK